MDLYVNDVKEVDGYNFEADSASNWNNKMMSQAIRVNLQAGTNKVRLSVGGRNNMPALDALYLSNLGYFGGSDATLLGGATLYSGTHYGKTGYITANISGYA